MVYECSLGLRLGNPARRSGHLNGLARVIAFVADRQPRAAELTIVELFEFFRTRHEFAAFPDERKS